MPAPCRMLPPPVTYIPQTVTAISVNQYEKQLIEKAADTHKTLTKTAAALNVSKQTLRYKMAKYQLQFM